MTADPFLQVAQVAQRLKCCQETVRRYIRRGQLPAERRPGDRRAGNYLIRESALQHFLATSHDTMRQPAA